MSGPNIVLIGAESASPFPMFERVWEIFSEKSIRTVFVSIGNSASSAADLDIAEAIGCPVHAVPLSSKGAAEWTEIQSILKEKKREGENATFAFTERAEQKWILPKNIRIQSKLPFWHEGQIKRENEIISTAPLRECMVAVATEMKIKEDEGRIDILKIDAKQEWPGLEKSIISAVLDAGYRPGLLLVNWSSKPDEDLSTTLAAGHLQNAGYKLCGKDDTRFLYFFTDNDIYQTCSWEDTTVSNPVVNEIGQQVLAAQKRVRVEVPSSL